MNESHWLRHNNDCIISKCGKAMVCRIKLLIGEYYMTYKVSGKSIAKTGKQFDNSMDAKRSILSEVKK